MNKIASATISQQQTKLTGTVYENGSLKIIKGDTGEMIEKGEGNSTQIRLQLQQYNV